jgi:uncharacterized membrane protein
LNKGPGERAIGVTLALAGIAALIVAGWDLVNHNGNVYNVKVIATCGILGLVFFFAGIGLVRSTKYTLKNNEHVT